MGVVDAAQNTYIVFVYPLSEKTLSPNQVVILSKAKDLVFSAFSPTPAALFWPRAVHLLALTYNE
jgi:hypothetical protein